MLSVLTDISELKMLEQQVRRSDRVSALGTMVAGVAHEIKNPLTSMKMFVQLMEEHKHDKNFWEEYGSIIATEVERLETIIEDFLGFARTPEVNIKPVCLKDIVNKVFQLVKTQSRKENVDIAMNIEEDMAINCDTQKIMQVFLNLILNAIQAMPQDRAEKGSVEFNARKDVANKKVAIQVKDNGIGISKENLDKLFTPFFTTKIKGNGLGLSIAHKIIEEHQGTIDVKSEIGKGTTFFISLPLA
jgi:signal transduction histidine kinase